MSQPAPQLILVKDFMTASLVTFTPDMSILDAVYQLVNHRISGAPVVDDRGQLLGMLTEKDCLKISLLAGYHGGTDGRVSELMSQNVVTVDAHMSIIDLAQQFIAQPYRRYPVLKDGRLVGIISRRDVLKALLKR
ncbi:MAG: CBS domain-containing protein [Xanthomonadales bacterium]|nr:CBS domain-containing protein [Xanthomonadales bacterium]